MGSELAQAIQRHADLGELDEALACCRERLAQVPDDAEAHRHAARILSAQGCIDAASQRARRACVLAPDDARAWLDRGLVEAQAGRFEDARQCFVRALALDPGCADAWHDLGTVLKATGRDEEALDALREALRLDPQRADTYLNLGNLMVRAGQLDDAVECFERAAARDPAMARARGRLAQALSVRGQPQRAESLFRQSLGLAPDHVDAWLGLGRALEDLGRAGEARDCYWQALTRHPDDLRALGAWFALGGGEVSADRVEAAHARLDAPGATETRALLGYGLARYHDRRCEFAESARTATKANALRRETAGTLDRGALQARVDGIVAGHPRAFFEERHGWGVGTDQPVFIVGLPRSGTTLTEQILAAHPLLHGGGEIPDLAQAALALTGAAGLEPWQASGRLDQAHSLERAYVYLRGLRRDAPRGVLRITDKSPLNFFHLGLAALLFPNARVIHCRRATRDNALSIWLENFNAEQRWATDFDDLAFFAAQERRLMSHWRTALPLPILEVRYEDTVADVEAQARRLCAFVDVPWDRRCLSFHDSGRSVQTPSRWQVRRPIYPGSVGRASVYAPHLPALESAFPGAA